MIKALEGDSIGTELENNKALNELLKKTNLMVSNQRTDKLNMLLQAKATSRMHCMAIMHEETFNHPIRPEASLNVKIAQ